MMIGGSPYSPTRIICSDRWLGLLDSLNLGGLTIDMNRRVTACNQRALVMLGRTETDVVGRDCREIFHRAPCHTSCPFDCPDEDLHLNREVEVPNSGNSGHLVVRLAAPVFDERRRLGGYLIILQERLSLTDLINRVNYGEKSLKILLDHLELAIFTVNQGGLITFFNDTAESLTGYDRWSVLGKPGQLILGAEAGRTWTGIQRCLSEGGPGSSEPFQITTFQGEVVDVKADFLPLTNVQEQIVGCLVTLHDLTLAKHLDEVIADQVSFHNMIGKDPAMQQIFETVRQIAVSDATVLLEGETGTGKDLMAKVIHAASLRRDRPWVKVNCAALPDNLLESEIFGYIKGAFTGADRDKPGRFQEADGGTILLDEIGDLPLSLQAKLLRVLEDKEFYPLGSQHTVRVDVRIIASTNRNLEHLLTSRLFREDLFYRLNVCRIDIPPLRERRGDLPLLIRHLLRRLCTTHNRKMPGVSAQAMDVLLRYHYPGNVRELENLLEYALVTCQDNRILAENLQGYIQPRMQKRRVDSTAVDAQALRERKIILDMLERHQWRRKRTAEALAMDRTTLWRKMKKYGIA